MAGMSMDESLISIEKGCRNREKVCMMHLTEELVVVDFYPLFFSFSGISLNEACII